MLYYMSLQPAEAQVQLRGCGTKFKTRDGYAHISVKILATFSLLQSQSRVPNTQNSISPARDFTMQQAKSLQFKK